MVAATGSNSNQGKKMGGFRSLFKRKKEEVVGKKADEVTIPEKAVGTTAKPSRTVDAPSKGAIASHSSPHTPPKTEPTTEPMVVESRPPVPEVAIVKGTSKAARASWFSRTHYFKEMSNWAFDVVDLDGSGYVDEKVRASSRRHELFVSSQHLVVSRFQFCCY